MLTCGGSCKLLVNRAQRLGLRPRIMSASLNVIVVIIIAVAVVVVAKNNKKYIYTAPCYVFAGRQNSLLVLYNPCISYGRDVGLSVFLSICHTLALSENEAS